MFVRKKMFVYCLSMLFSLTLSAMQELCIKEQGGALINAASDGDLDQIHSLLASGVDVMYKQLGGDDALYYATGGGHADCVRALISAGADPNAPYESRGDRTPLHVAATRNYAVCIKVLLEMGAHPSPYDRDTLFTPLHIAVSGKGKFFESVQVLDFFESVEALLVGGADVNAKHLKSSPLAFAVDSSRSKSAKLLLQAGARPFEKGSVAIPTLMDDARYTLKELEESPVETPFYQGIDCREIKNQRISKAQDMIALLQEYQTRWRGMQEFCKAQHPRLGAESPAHALPKDVYKPIFNQLLRLK